MLHLFVFKTFGPNFNFRSGRSAGGNYISVRIEASSEVKEKMYFNRSQSKLWELL